MTVKKQATSAKKTAKVKQSTGKFVYFFGGDHSEGHAGMRSLLGGKGANLAEMAELGLPVPPGFTITTEACAKYYELGEKTLHQLIDDQVAAGLKKLEETTGKTFGKGSNPLLVPVRSGAAASMPGMMDTVLNLGLNPDTVEAMIKKTGNARFVWDSYRRFIQMFGNVVMGIEHDLFEHELDVVKQANNYKLDTELTVEDLQEVVKRYRRHDPAEPRHQRGVRLLEQCPRDQVPRPERHPRPARHRRQCPGDGFRQLGPEFRDGRRLHP